MSVDQNRNLTTDKGEMKVCIFGGAGFIGSRIVKCLLSNGYEVVTLVRNQQKAAQLAQLGAIVQIGDIRNEDNRQKVIKGANIVINAAVPSYQGRVGLKRVRAIARQHMENIKNILEEAKRVGNLPVIVSEGIMMWGDSGNDWFDETTKLNPLGMGRVGELAVPYVQKMIEEKEAPIIRLSAGAVYGAGSWFKRYVYPFMKKGWYRTFGDGENIISFVYVDDLAEAYRLAVEKQPLGELFAVVDDHPAKFKDFANCVARVMGKPLVKSIPKWIANIMAGKAMVETLTINCKVRNTKAKEKLGWLPTYVSFEQGIPKAVADIERMQF